MEVKRLMGSGHTLTAHGKEYSPEQIQSRLLRYLANCAADYLGEKVTRAVITVPAYFTDVQRKATVRAGELAGLTVERILNEPTAAALDYGLENLTECKNILVYDLGGGTLDITVLELFEGVIDVKASSGNNHLGGKDFDEALMRHLAGDVSDERARMRLKTAAEECKRTLSGDQSFKVSLPFLFSSGDGKPAFVDKTVTRDDFETLIRDMVESSEKPMMSALSDAGLAPKDLDIVLLVGGSTRIPIVKKTVGQTLSIVPQPFVEPELTVARGAAIQAAIMDGTISQDLGLVLTDVCPYTLGTSVLQGGFFNQSLVFDPIIPRNTAIPTDVSKIYYPSQDYQTIVNIMAYQGESSDPDENELLGELMLTGIPAARVGKQPVEITFSYDTNGILSVRGRVVSTGKEVSCEINTTGIEPLKESVVDTSKWLDMPGAKKYRPLIRKAEKLLQTDSTFESELTRLVNEVKKAIVLDDDSLTEHYKDELMDLIAFIDNYD
jgi:molecular chaperone DnaK